MRKYVAYLSIWVMFLLKKTSYVQAEIYFQEGLELARQIGHREWMSIFLLNLGMTARKQDHYNEAKPYLQESLALANQSKPTSYYLCYIVRTWGSFSI